MTSLRLKFRPSTANGKEGTLFFILTHRRATRTIYTEFHIKPNEWNDYSSAVKISGTPERQAQLQLIASKVNWSYKLLKSIIAEKETSCVEYSADDIIEAYRRLPPYQTWFCFIRDMVEMKISTGRMGTAKTYRDALSSFAKFRNGEDITADALEPRHIAQYEAWLKSRGLNRKSSSCYLRTLRTLYRKAVETGLTMDKDIFRHVFTGFAKTAKRAITIESVRKIRQIKLDDGSPIAFARDMFILSIYLQGMAFVDLAYLKKTDVRNGLLMYKRKKTRQNLAIGWEPQMQEIVNLYTHLTKESPYLLPIITKPDGTERQQYEKMEHNVNRNLKKLGCMAGLNIPLTTYVARHTWASTMRDLGVDLSIISTGLGHDSLRTTQIYLSTIDNASVTKANQMMINKLLAD